MATVNKDFKVKHGLIVEGTTATVNSYDVLTKKQADQDYIIGLAGGGATSANEANKVVKRDANGDFAAGTITADLVGDVTGTVSDISNHYTDGLQEGLVNKYFTDQRALDATASAYDPAGSAANAELAAIAAANAYTDGEISDEVLARDAAILLAKNDAIADAAADATTKANQALSDANDYTDGAISTEVTNRNNAIATAKSEAITSSNSYTDGQISTEVTNRNNAIATAKSEAISSSNSYTDGEISAEATRADAYADQVALAAENNAKAYADGLSSGLNWKQAVNLLSTTNVDISGSANPWPIDGHAKPTEEYRILLTAQSTDSENGIWVFDPVTETFARPADADAFSELVGAAVFVMEGTNYASTAWVQADHYLSSFAGQDWTQFSGQGTYLAGNGLTLDGTTFEIDQTITATRAYAESEADAAELAANNYTDGRETAITNAYQSYADQAESDAISSANSYTDGREIAITTAYQGYADQAESDAISSANSYTDNREIAITTAYENYADGVALTAEQNANFYTDGKIADEVSDRNLAITNAINALSTSDIEEGTNQYYTSTRAKTDAAALLTSANLTNIQITGDQNGLTITAENGVADSTTDDLGEGVNNLYFTDSRAVSALEAVVPNFTAVEVNSVAKQVAATLSAPTAGIQSAFSWASVDYRSAEFLVKVAYGSHTEVSKVLLTLDTSDNIAITEYAIVGTNGSASSISAGISGSNVELKVTTVNNNSTVTVVGTLLA